MTEPVVLSDVDARGVATVTLNRPDRFNAYNLALLEGTISALEELAANPSVRVVVIAGAGKHFQAGADLAWLKEIAAYPPDENRRMSEVTTQAVRGLNEFPHPTVALVQGACFGGGVGIACCCDVVLASDDASFGITEVRVGVLPSPITLNLFAALGLRQARRYALTGERFDAAEALRIGLVHEVLPRDQLRPRADAIVEEILKGGPQAIAATKADLLKVSRTAMDDALLDAQADAAAARRASDEAREGLAAFADKRPPKWYRGAGD
jgi:methylglutaconyl-CoA hydratase